ncbi:hypothetical protein [Acrocarpospora sp. B8E8]|uniref:hypothetical protein n=1 Tax=Acrocarpospora sp. B8E8 TaxID=3153572 RepID=UPI00325D4A3E
MPADVITPDTVEEVFDLRYEITTDPVSGTPLIISIGRHRRARDEPKSSIHVRSS